LIKEGQIPADAPLPPILPIVLYNGQERWTAVTDIFDLIPPVPGLVEKFKPHFSYLLVNENDYSESELASLKNLVAAVFRLEHPASPEVIGGLLTLLEELIVNRPELRRIFAQWIRATLMRNPEYGILLPMVDDLQELKVMLSERLEEWALGFKAEGEARGEQRGRQDGEARTLQRLLTRRFGELTPELASRIAGAPLEELETWFDRGIDARTLEDVFGPTMH